MTVLSVIVPTYNEAKNVAAMYSGLADTLRDMSWELIVVDDDSPDGTADVVRDLARQHDNVRCIQRIQERGLCSAVQWGVQAAHGDVCLLYTSPSPRDGLLSRMPSSA